LSRLDASMFKKELAT
jgi:hypothetical protein